jgi:hypothetical protein
LGYARRRDVPVMRVYCVLLLSYNSTYDPPPNNTTQHNTWESIRQNIREREGEGRREEETWRKVRGEEQWKEIGREGDRERGRDYCLGHPRGIISRIH